MSGPRLSPAALDAIVARANAATPGPWIVAPGANYCGEANAGSIRSGGEPGGWYLAKIEPDAPRPTADAEFIAAARTDVPALVDEVRRLQRRGELFLRFYAAYRGLWGGDVLAGLLADIDEEIGEEWRAYTPDAEGEP